MAGHPNRVPRGESVGFGPSLRVNRVILRAREESRIRGIRFGARARAMPWNFTLNINKDGGCIEKSNEDRTKRY